jgi:hypothetical protein
VPTVCRSERQRGISSTGTDHVLTRSLVPRDDTDRAPL